MIVITQNTRYQIRNLSGSGRCEIKGNRKYCPNWLRCIIRYKPAVGVPFEFTPLEGHRLGQATLTSRVISIEE